MKVKESFPERTDLKRLEVIPGIGKSLSRDLWRLGIREVADLKGKNPLEMYERLSVLTGIRQDPCVLYTFRCAVYFASEPDPRRRNSSGGIGKTENMEKPANIPSNRYFFNL